METISVEMVIVYFEQYLIQKKTTYNTFISYKKDLTDFKFFLGAAYYEPFQQVTEQTVVLFLSYLEQQNFHLLSRVRKLTTIKMLFSFAHMQYSFENKMASFKRPSLARYVPVRLTKKQAITLFTKKTTSLSPDRLIIYLFYVARISLSVLQNLTVTSFKGNSLYINSKRIIYLPSSVASYMRKYYAQHNQQIPYLFYVISHNTPCQFSIHALKNIVKKAVLLPKRTPNTYTCIVSAGFFDSSLQIKEKKLLKELYEKAHPRR